MLVKTSELIGAALDWAVAKCEGVEVEYINDGITKAYCDWRHPMVDTARQLTGHKAVRLLKGGEVVSMPDASSGWIAKVRAHTGKFIYGQTPLIAAMRCYVASKLGDYVDVPEELAC